MDLTGVTVGAKLELDTGAYVEVLEEPRQDRRSVKVRCIESLLGPEQPGSEWVVSADEVYGIFEGGDFGKVR